MSAESAVKTRRLSCTNGSSLRLCGFTSSYQTLLIAGTENVRLAKFEIALVSSNTNIPVILGTIPEGVHIYLFGSTVWIKVDASRHIEFYLPLTGTQIMYLDNMAIPDDAVEL